ncbi:MAG: hypothetical protein LBI57_01565 [Helicobacteraceae bacterium]|jgi:hypothetical protein|nr:hypothetical protein [Helicobacteraceae bacterium]
MSAKKEGLGAKFENFVARLDEWVGQRKPNELLIIAAAIPLLLLALDYKFVVPKTEAMSVQSRADHKAIVDEIEGYKSGGGKEEVERLRVETAQMRDDCERLETTEAYIQSRLTELDHLFFTRLEWAQHLDFITQKATEYRVTIQMQENAIEAEQPGFAPVMNVTLDGQGGFASTLRYLFLVEASEKITPIEELTLEIDEKDRLAFKAKSVLWGLR